MASEISRISSGAGISFDELSIRREPEPEEEAPAPGPSPVQEVLEALAARGELQATSDEIKVLADRIADGLSEKIVLAKYGAPINRRVVNWLRGRIRR